jgi:hypothetical protein
VNAAFRAEQPRHHFFVAHTSEPAMTKITVDPMLMDRLLNLAEPLELCDESGHVLGRFFPNQVPSDPELRKPQISDEEIERRAKSNDWLTTAEVLAHLERL